MVAFGIDKKFLPLSPPQTRGLILTSSSIVAFFTTTNQETKASSKKGEIHSQKANNCCADLGHMATLPLVAFCGDAKWEDNMVL
jgi:hypothetical protein